MATEQVVVGTLRPEPVLLTIRRIAQDNVSQRSLGWVRLRSRAQNRLFCSSSSSIRLRSTPPA